MTLTREQLDTFRSDWEASGSDLADEGSCRSCLAASHVPVLVEEVRALQSDLDKARHFKAECQRAREERDEALLAAQAEAKRGDGLAAEVTRLRGIVAKQANDSAKLTVDRDEWREVSRDWRQRAERAEKVERLWRDALVRIEGYARADRDEIAGVARAALREASEVRVERVKGDGDRG